jgi:hypothetical protein
VYDKNTAIICGLFHERMDISTRLIDLQSLTQREIEAPQRELGAR